MIGIEDAPHTYAYDDYYKILPMIHRWSSDPSRIKNGKKVSDDFMYSSGSNSEWMTIERLQAWLESNQQKMGVY